MAIYQYDSSIGETPPTIINGPPPADQSALIATLQAKVTGLQAFADAAKADADARKAADATKVEGQNLIDLYAAIP